MGKQKAPAPPDPKDTSAAQTGTSVATSIANALLQNVKEQKPKVFTLLEGASQVYERTAF